MSVKVGDYAIFKGSLWPFIMEIYTVRPEYNAKYYGNSISLVHNYPIAPYGEGGSVATGYEHEKITKNQAIALILGLKRHRFQDELGQ